MGVLCVVAAEDLLHDPLVGGNFLSDLELARPGQERQLIVLGILFCIIALVVVLIVTGCFLYLLYDDKQGGVIDGATLLVAKE